MADLVALLDGLHLGPVLTLILALILWTLLSFSERIRKLETWKAYINGLNEGQKGQ